jgi:uncharacterized repeat protein (TIGR02543 family)
MGIKFVRGTDIAVVEKTINDLIEDGYKLDSYQVTEFNNGTELAITAMLEEPVFTLTYDENTGSGEITAQTGEVIVVKNGTGFEPPTGDTFSKWNTKDDGTGTDYAPGDTIEMTEDLTLYAIWE